MKQILAAIFGDYTEWKLVDIYFFNTHWYAVQVRQNKRTGFKSFRCNKITDHNYGHNPERYYIEKVNQLFEKQNEKP